jgi:catechol 2,3-dioxygenase
MAVSHRAPRAAYLTTGARHHELVLRAGQVSSCAQIGFEVDTPAELDALAGRVADNGLEMLVTPGDETGIERAFAFLGPDGQVFQVVLGMARVSFDGRDARSVARPRALGHVSLKSPDPLRLEDVLIRVLGLRLSDRIADRAMWLRTGSDHHGIAIMREPAGIHHYAFALDGWETFCPAADLLHTQGHRLLWGPGRHGPGNNLFAYFLDPQGCVIEYYAELDRIVDEDAYHPRDWPATPDTLNVWGPPPPVGWHDHGLPYAPATAPQRAELTSQTRSR